MLSIRWAELPWVADTALSQLFKKNKREFARAKSHNLVKYHHPSSSAPTEHVSNIVNISEGGLQFRYHGNIAVGIAIRMSINLAELGRQIPVLGRVKWVSGSEGRNNHSRRVGVSFMVIQNEDKNFIHRFVRSHKKEFLSR